MKDACKPVPVLDQEGLVQNAAHRQRGDEPRLMIATPDFTRTSTGSEGEQAGEDVQYSFQQNLGCGIQMNGFDRCSLKQEKPLDTAALQRKAWEPWR